MHDEHGTFPIWSPAAAHIKEDPLPLPATIPGVPLGRLPAHVHLRAHGTPAAAVQPHALAVQRFPIPPPTNPGVRGGQSAGRSCEGGDQPSLVNRVAGPTWTDRVPSSGRFWSDNDRAPVEGRSAAPTRLVEAAELRLRPARKIRTPESTSRLVPPRIKYKTAPVFVTGPWLHGEEETWPLTHCRPRVPFSRDHEITPFPRSPPGIARLSQNLNRQNCIVALRGGRE